MLKVVRVIMSFDNLGTTDPTLNFIEFILKTYLFFNKNVLLSLMAADFYRYNAWKYQEELILVSLSA